MLGSSLTSFNKAVQMDVLSSCLISPVLPCSPLQERDLSLCSVGTAPECPHLQGFTFLQPFRLCLGLVMMFLLVVHCDFYIFPW